MSRSSMSVTLHVVGIICFAGITPGNAEVLSVAPRNFGISRPLRDLAPSTDQTPPPAPAIELVKTLGTTNLLNFDGVGDVSYVYPDSNGAAGATQYMQWTNTRYAVYSKTTGAKILGPINVRLLWGSLGGQCATTNAGDGIINYDKAAQRWIVTHHTGGGVPYLQCVAVSTSSDATGSYYLYAFPLTSTYYPDYPQLGVWPDAYYLTTNLLQPSNFANVSAQVCALDRNSMLIGSRHATAQCFSTTTEAAFSVLQPADLDGSTPPPAGTPNYLLALNNNSLDLYKFHVDFVNPANSSLSGPTNMVVKPFTQACSSGPCIPQPGTTNLLDGVGDRLVHRLAYRNFGSFDTMVISHSIAVGSTVGVRWYEIRNPATTPVVRQGSNYAPDSNYRWLPSIGMDKNQDIVVGYSVSSASMYPGIRYAGRLSNDAPNTLEAEVNIFAGSGAQTASGNNWGNASSMSIDPVDDCTFWYTNEYMRQTGTLWNSRLASFKFTACN